VLLPRDQGRQPLGPGDLRPMRQQPIELQGSGACQERIIRAVPASVRDRLTVG
jgi:hypothetical protein